MVDFGGLGLGQMPVVLEKKIGCYGNRGRAKCAKVEFFRIFSINFFTLLHLPRVTMGSKNEWGKVFCTSEFLRLVDRSSG